MTVDDTAALFSNHSVHAVLASTRVQARDMLEKLEANLDDTGRKRLRHIVNALAFTSEVISRADPELVTTVGALDAIKQHVDAVANALASFGSGNPGGIKQAFIATDAVLSLIGRFPPRVVIDGAAELSKLITGLRENQDAVLSEATKKFAEAIQAVHSAQQEAERDIGKTVAAAAEMAASVDRIQQQVVQQSGRLDSALSSFSTNSTTLEQGREARFLEWLEKQAQGFSSRATDEIGKVSALLKSVEAAADATVKELDQTKAEAAKILNVIGNIGTTGNYKLAADANEKSANSLRTGAVLLFLLMVIVVVSLAFNAIHEGVKWSVALFRLVSVLILSLPAAYLARESARHREVAERMRRMELELASIDAFNALLPETERNAIKAEMARKYFGNGGQAVSNDKESKEEAGIVGDLLEKATSLVKAIRN